MFLILLAAAAGVGAAVALGPSSPWAAPGDALLDSVSHAAQSAVSSMTGSGSTEGALVGLLAATLAPGLLCVLLAEAVRAGRGARRKAAAALVLGALSTFAFLPAPQAAVLLVLSVPAAALLSFVAGALLLAPLAGACAFLAARVVVRVWATTPDDAVLALLDRVLPLGHGWVFILAGVACAPVLAAARRLLGPAS